MSSQLPVWPTETAPADAFAYEVSSDVFIFTSAPHI